MHSGRVMLCVWICLGWLEFAAVLSTAAHAANTGLVAAVLPTSRSVQIGAPATLFATIIGTTPLTLSGCRVEADPELPIAVSFQQTDPLTNRIIGGVNSPVELAGRTSASFLIVLESDQEISPVDVALRFVCDPGLVADSVSGINTVRFSASQDPVPDLVALAATTTNDGIVLVPGRGRANALSVATFNAGAGGQMTVEATLSDSALPVSLSWCQTNPLTGQCLGDGPTSLPLAFNAGAGSTPTFGVFVGVADGFSFDPAKNRVYVSFTDSTGALRGSTSVALRVSLTDDPLTVTSANAVATINRVASAFSRMVRWKDLAMTALQLASASPTLEFTSECINRPSYSILDRDGNAQLSSGDALTVVYRGCSPADLNGWPEGTMVIELANLTQDVNRRFVLLEATVQFDRMTLVPNVQSDPERRASGSFSIDYFRTSQKQSTTLRIGGESGFSEEAVGLTETLRNVEIKQTGELARPRQRALRVRGELASGLIDGRVTCQSTDFSISNDNRYQPIGGDMICTGAGASRAVLSSPDIMLTSPDSDSPLAPVGSIVWAASDLSTLVEAVPDYVFEVPDRVQRTLPAIANLDIPVSAIATSASTGLFYVVNSQEMTAIDPAGGAVVATVPLQHPPSAISVGANGTLLYVGYSGQGSVQVIDLETNTPGQVIELGLSPNGESWSVESLSASPTEDLFVALLREDTSSFRPTAIALIRDGVVAPEIIDNVSPELRPLIREDGRVFTYLDRSMIELTVSASGLAFGTTLGWRGDMDATGTMTAGSSRFYTSAGGVLDFDAGTQVGRFKGPNTVRRNSLLAVSEANRQAVSVDRNELITFDTERFVPTARYQLPGGLSAEFLAQTADRIIVADESELAIINRNDLREFDIAQCLRIELVVLGFATNSQRYNCGLSDVQYSAATDRFYGLASSEQGLDGNTLWVINPATLVVENKLFVGASPTTLAISDDGTLAYVGFSDASELAQIDLSDERVVRRIALTSETTFGSPGSERISRQPQFAVAAAFARGRTDETVVSVKDYPLKLLRDGQLLSRNDNEFIVADLLIYSQSNTEIVYGLSDGDVFLNQITDEGVRYDSYLGDVAAGRRLAVAGQSLYTIEGQKIELPGLAETAQYDLASANGEDYPYATQVAVDLSSDSVFFQVSDPQLSIAVFQESTGLLLSNSSSPLIRELLGAGFSAGLSAAHPDWLVFSSGNSVTFLPKSEAVE